MRKFSHNHHLDKTIPIVINAHRGKYLPLPLALAVETGPEAPATTLLSGASGIITL